MSVPRPAGSTPIDDFLAGAGDTTAGERWEAIGAGLGLGGTVLAVGILALLALVHRGRRSEVRSLLRAARIGGALMVVGGAIEIAGTADVLDIGWTDAFRDGSAASAMLRLLGGTLLLLGLGDETAAEHATPRTGSGTGDDRDAGEPTERWVPGASSAFGLVGAAIGALSFAFDGHTVSEGPRILHAVTNVVHVVAAGVWSGGVVGLAAVATMRRRAGSIGPLLGPFSRVVTVALVAVFVAGAGLAVMILDGVGELTATEWGRRLLLKLAAVGVAALLGAYHHLLVVPRAAAGDACVEQLARRTLVVEAVVLTLAAVLTALLTRSSIA